MFSKEISSTERIRHTENKQSKEPLTYMNAVQNISEKTQTSSNKNNKNNNFSHDQNLVGQMMIVVSFIPSEKQNH